MLRTAVLLVGLLALTRPPLATAAPLPAPTAVLPWGDGPGEPGLLPGGDERPPVGPVALAADATRVIISDAAHRQLLVLDAGGRVVDVWPSDFAAVDLALLADGRVAALDARGDRVQLGDGQSAWRPLTPPGDAPIAALAVGPDGDAWVVDTLGRGRALEGPAATAAAATHATPLGPAAALHATGRRVDARAGELLVWPWARAAEVRPPGPSLTLPIAAADRLLGTVRALGVDDRGVLHVLVETLAPGPRVSVGLEVRQFSARDGATLGAFAWDVDDVAPINRAVAVTADGTLVIMAALPEGLALWRVPTAAPGAGGAR